jgi:hypothetical protein
MFLTLDDTIKLINQNKLLHIAADESLLSKLPKGKWIGGTTPYFITNEGGVTCKDRLFVNVFDFAVNYKIKTYDKEGVLKLTDDAYDNGLCLLLMPFASEVAVKYAKEAPYSSELLMTPVFGWITGFDLSAKATAKVYDGQTLTAYEDRALVLHIELSSDKLASIGIVNIFSADEEGPVIEFKEDTLKITSALINGKEMNFHDYLTENKIDTKLPLVSDYNGILVNVSIKALSAADKSVELYAPVFAGTKYRFSRPIGDYAAEFKDKLSASKDILPIFSCNCILNYLYGNLEGKSTPPFAGPVTFGEIAYQLLNQTLVYAQL